MTRRDCLRLFAITPIAGACSHRTSPRFQGYALIANQESRTIAVVNLSNFQLLTILPVAAPPSWILAFPAAERAFVLSPESSSMEVLNLDTLRFESSIGLGGKPQCARLSEDMLWIALKDPNALSGFSARSGVPTGSHSLPGAASDMDIVGDQIALAFGDLRRAASFSPSKKTLAVSQPLGAAPRLIRLRPDGKVILTGNTSERSVTAIDAESLRTMVELPLAVAPRHFCFNSDGGQLFVTGDGLDAVVVISPYQTEVGETLLAGSSPGNMAATSSGPQYLFVANQQSGDLTVLNIDNRRVLAQIPVGQRPGAVLLTPDNEYALVLNEQSGDLAVIRLLNIRQATLISRRRRMAALFTLISVGAKPVSAAIAPRLT